MASIGYEYEPESDIEDQPQGAEEEICFSTKLDELDKYDLINRHSDELNQVLLDNMSPNILQKPFSAKTIPPGGIASAEPIYEPPVVSELVEDRKQDIGTLTNEENKKITEQFEKSKLMNMSLEEFIRFIANSYLDIINDLLELQSINDIPTIFLKNDRLIAIGILLLGISLFFIFFNQL